MAVLAALAVLGSACGGGAGGARGLDIGPGVSARDLPPAVPEPLTVEEFQGVLVGLRGTPVIVNFWASWCVPCRAEAPLLDEMAGISDGPAGRVQFLGVATNDLADDARDFVAEFGITYPNMLDPVGEIAVFMNTTGLPTTYALDREGRVVDVERGALDRARLEELISAVS